MYTLLLADQLQLLTIVYNDACVDISESQISWGSWLFREIKDPKIKDGHGRMDHNK